MKRDPSVTANLARIDNRKGNTIKPVETLPDIANEGDMVLMHGTLHIRLEGQWQNIDTNLSNALQLLTARVKALEDE